MRPRPEHWQWAIRGQILVMTRAGAIAVRVGDDSQQRLAFGTEEPAFGDALTNTFMT
jgi:hypothetical protein